MTDDIVDVLTQVANEINDRTGKRIAEVNINDRTGDVALITQRSTSEVDVDEDEVRVLIWLPVNAIAPALRVVKDKEGIKVVAFDKVYKVNASRFIVTEAKNTAFVFLFK